MRILLFTLLLALSPQVAAQQVDTSIGSMFVSAESVTFDLPGSRGVTVPRDVVALATSDVDGYSRMTTYLNTRVLVLYALAEETLPELQPIGAVPDSLLLLLQEITDAYDTLHADYVQLQADYVQLQGDYAELESQLATIEQTHADEIAALEAQHAQAIQALADDHATEIASIAAAIRAARDYILNRP